MNAHDKVSPFTLAAAKEGLEYMGGKVDECVSHSLLCFRNRGESEEGRRS
jgi:hypothetical protein